MEQIISEIQLSYKPALRPSEMPKIASSADIFAILSYHWEKGKIDYVEQLKVLLLNRANGIIGIVDISSGGITSSIADPKVIFGCALKAGACALVLAHNHPSGNLKPSKSDLALTNKIKEGGKLLDLMLLDHLIVSSEGYLSMADEGLL